jgi:hypothetical protein
MNGGGKTGELALGDPRLTPAVVSPSAPTPSPVASRPTGDSNDGASAEPGAATELTPISYRLADHLDAGPAAGSTTPAAPAESPSLLATVLPASACNVLDAIC